MKDEFDLPDDNFNIDEPDNSRSVASGIPRDVVAGVLDGIKEEDISTQASEVASKALPAMGLGRNYHELQIAKRSIDGTLRDAMAEVNVAAKPVVDILKDIVPEDSFMRKFLRHSETGSSSSYDAEEEYNPAQFFQQAEEQKKLLLEQTSTQVEATKSSSTQIVQMLDIANNYNLSYYKKSLEYQYKLLYETTKSNKTTSALLVDSVNILRSINKNVGLPDFVKLKTSEAVKQNIRERMVSSLYDSGHVKTLGETIGQNFKSYIQTKVATSTDFLEQASTSAELAKETSEAVSDEDLEMMGTTRVRLLASTLLPQMLREYGGRKLGEALHKMPGVQGYAERVDDVFNNGYETVSNLRSDLENKGQLKRAGVVGFFEQMLRDDTTLTNNFTSVTGDPDEVRVFDTRVYDSITTVIPTYLSRMVTLLGGISTTYDFGTGKFIEQSTKSLEDGFRRPIENSVEIDELRSLKEKGFTVDEIVKLAQVSKQGEMAVSVTNAVDSESLDDSIKEKISKITDREERKAFNDTLKSVRHNGLKYGKRVEEYYKSGMKEELLKTGILKEDDVSGEYYTDNDALDAFVAERYRDILNNKKRERHITAEETRKISDYKEELRRKNIAKVVNEQKDKQLHKQGVDDRISTVLKKAKFTTDPSDISIVGYNSVYHAPLGRYEKAKLEFNNVKDTVKTLSKKNRRKVKALLKRQYQKELKRLGLHKDVEARDFIDAEYESFIEELSEKELIKFLKDKRARGGEIKSQVASFYKGYTQFNPDIKFSVNKPDSFNDTPFAYTSPKRTVNTDKVKEDTLSYLAKKKQQLEQQFEKVNPFKVKTPETTYSFSSNKPEDFKEPKPVTDLKDNETKTLLEAIRDKISEGNESAKEAFGLANDLQTFNIFGVVSRSSKLGKKGIELLKNKSASYTPEFVKSLYRDKKRKLSIKKKKTFRTIRKGITFKNPFKTKKPKGYSFSEQAPLGTSPLKPNAKIKDNPILSTLQTIKQRLTPENDKDGNEKSILGKLIQTVKPKVIRKGSYQDILNKRKGKQDIEGGVKQTLKKKGKDLLKTAILFGALTVLPAILKGVKTVYKYGKELINTIKSGYAKFKGLFDNIGTPLKSMLAILTTIGGALVDKGLIGKLFKSKAKVGAKVETKPEKKINRDGKKRQSKKGKGKARSTRSSKALNRTKTLSQISKNVPKTDFISRVGSKLTGKGLLKGAGKLGGKALPILAVGSELYEAGGRLADGDVKGAFGSLFKAMVSAIPFGSVAVMAYEAFEPEIKGMLETNAKNAVSDADAKLTRVKRHDTSNVIHAQDKASVSRSRHRTSKVSSVWKDSGAVKYIGAGSKLKPEPKQTTYSKKVVKDGLDDALLARIAKGEVNTSQSSGYNTVIGFGKFGKPKKPLTDMTIQEIVSFQRKLLKNGAPSTAVGRYQFLKRTLLEEAKHAGIPLTTKLTPDVQDMLILNRLKRFRGYSKFKQGKISEKKFIRNLSMEFASIEDPYKNGKGHYSGQGVHTTVKQLHDVFTGKMDYKSLMSYKSGSKGNTFNQSSFDSNHQRSMSDGSWGGSRVNSPFDLDTGNKVMDGMGMLAGGLMSFFGTKSTPKPKSDIKSDIKHMPKVKESKVSKTVEPKVPDVKIDTGSLEKSNEQVVQQSTKQTKTLAEQTNFMKQSNEINTEMLKELRRISGISNVNNSTKTHNTPSALMPVK